MRTFIILIPVEGSVINPRKACELIENTQFEIDNSGQMTLTMINDNENVTKVLREIMFKLGISTPHNIEVEYITDFMDRFNNEEINVDNYFISYVYA